MSYPNMEEPVPQPPLTQEAVLKAIDEFDVIGREAFLQKYGFGEARGYFLTYEGREYDSKAIAAAAYGFMPGGSALANSDLSGGDKDAVQRLERLGFTVRKPVRNPDWSWDEHVLALELYIRSGRRSPRAHSKEVIELSSVLRALAKLRGVAGNAKLRSPDGVHMKLENLSRFDPEQQASGRKGLPKGGGGEEAVWARFGHDLKELVAEADGIRAALADPALLRDDLSQEYEGEEGRLVMRLHRSRERDPQLSKRKKSQALARYGSLKCEVCEFDFAARYGELGAGFIEAHHRRPIASLTEKTTTTLSDLALVCANCHRMLHKGGRLTSLEEPREKLQG